MHFACSNKNGTHVRFMIDISGMIRIGVSPPRAAPRKELLMDPQTAVAVCAMLTAFIAIVNLLDRK